MMYEVTSTVTFIVEAVDEYDAIGQVEEILSDVAYDWTMPATDPTPIAITDNKGNSKLLF